MKLDQLQSRNCRESEDSDSEYESSADGEDAGDPNYQPSEEDQPSEEEDDMVIEGEVTSPPATNTLNRMMSACKDIRRAVVHIPRINSRKQVSVNPRKRKRCQICNIEVLDMARHMRHAHDAESRIQYSNSNAEENTEKAKPCIFEGCSAKVVRMARHLTNVHKMEKGDAHMQILLARTRATSTKETELSRIFSNYEEFLKSAESSKNERSAAQHATQVRAIAQSFEAPTVGTFLNVPKLLAWLEGFKTDKMPGTVKSYLGSLKDFLNYLQIKKIMAEEARVVVLSVNRWAAALNKRVRERAIERLVIDDETCISTEDVASFRKSSTVAGVWQLIEEFREGDILDQRTHARVRDYLMLEVLLTNGQRAGAISAITLGHLQKATKEEGGVQISISNHKTGFRTVAVLNVAEKTVFPVRDLQKYEVDDSVT